MNDQLISRCRDVKVTLEDVSHLCETVESSEKDGQVSNHSADPFLAKDRKYLNSFPDKIEIAWPSMNDGPAWKAFEESVMKHLSPATHGISVGARLHVLEDTVYECASTAFGHKLPPLKQSVSHFSDNRSKVIKLVKTKNDLLTQIDLSCNPQEQVGHLQVHGVEAMKQLQIQQLHYFLTVVEGLRHIPNHQQNLDLFHACCNSRSSERTTSNNKVPAPTHNL